MAITKVKAHTRNGKRVKEHVRHYGTLGPSDYRKYYAKKGSGQEILRSNSGPLDNNPSTHGRMRDYHKQQHQYHKNMEKKMLDKVVKVSRQSTRDKYTKIAMEHGKKAQQHFRHF